jgi:hypothetical protein
MQFSQDELFVLLSWIGGGITTDDACRAFGITRSELCAYEMSALNEGREIARAKLADMPLVRPVTCYPALEAS